MSYSKNVAGTDATPYNHFVVFDELNLLACHDFQVSKGCAKLTIFLFYQLSCPPCGTAAALQPPFDGFLGKKGGLIDSQLLQSY